ncbi:MAG: NAD-dependent epimerase/dehydratase family protein [Candidatus Helarchaeales archaeon]
MVKTALVTGARGHTGTYMLKLLIEKGFKITATDLKPLEREKLMTKEKVFRSDLKYQVIEHPNVTFIPANLMDKDTLRELWFDDIQYDVVFHPASLYDYFAPLHILMKINVTGTRNLLEVICEKQPNKLPRFIHWSTCGVYGEPKYKWVKNERGKKVKVPADETAPYDPPNWYSTSKMFQEFVVYDFYKNKGVPMTIIRPMPISGPEQLYGAFNVYYVVAKMDKMGVPYFFPKKYQLAMPIVHVWDLVRAALFCFEHDETIGEAYNVGCDNCTEGEFMDYCSFVTGADPVIIPIWGVFYKLVQKLVKIIMGRSIKKAEMWGTRAIVDAPMLDYITHDYFFSNQKLKDLGFKYEFPTPFDVAKDSIRWYIDHGWFDRVEVKE